MHFMYYLSTFIYLHSSTGSWSQKIWLDDVDCASSAYNCIANCASCPSTAYGCSHSEDVTIECGKFCFYEILLLLLSSIGALVSSSSVHVSTTVDTCVSASHQPTTDGKHNYGGNSKNGYNS